MTTPQPITTKTSTNKSQDEEQEPRPLPDTDHYTDQATRHEQQDARTTGSRERSEDAHLGITIRGFGPACGRPEVLRATGVLAEPPWTISERSSEC